MRKIARFVFETAYGPFVTWCCATLLLFATYAISPPLGRFGTAMVNTMSVVQAIAAIVTITALVKSLAGHRYRRALGQFLLGLAGTSSGYAEVRSAGVTNETAALEFAVEYRPAHPFLAEYDKCIVFPSGKRIGVWMDTGGAGPFAVYRLPTGEYYLVDGLEFDVIRSDYRVNVTNETVEMMRGETWIKIPDKTLRVDGRSSGSISAKTADGERNASGGTPVGDSLKGRSYLGLLHPSGSFEPGEGDPFADIIEREWEAVK